MNGAVAGGLAPLDLLVITGVLLLVVGVGLVASRRAARGEASSAP